MSLAESSFEESGEYASIDGDAAVYWSVTGVQIVNVDK